MLRLSLLLKSSGVNTESSKESLHELAPLSRVSDVTVACSWCWAGICTDLPLSPCNTPLSLTIPSEPRRAYSCPLFILEDGFHISPWEDEHLPPGRSLDCLMFLCVLTYWLSHFCVIVKLSRKKLKKEAQTYLDWFGFASAFLRKSLIIVDAKNQLSPQREQRWIYSESNLRGRGLGTWVLHCPKWLDSPGADFSTTERVMMPFHLLSWRQQVEGNQEQEKF